MLLPTVCPRDSSFAVVTQNDIGRYLAPPRERYSGCRSSPRTDHVLCLEDSMGKGMLSSPLSTSTLVTSLAIAQKQRRDPTYQVSSGLNHSCLIYHTHFLCPLTSHLHDQPHQPLPHPQNLDTIPIRQPALTHDTALHQSTCPHRPSDIKTAMSAAA